MGFSVCQILKYHFTSIQVIIGLVSGDQLYSPLDACLISNMLETQEEWSCENDLSVVIVVNLTFGSNGFLVELWKNYSPSIYEYPNQMQHGIALFHYGMRLLVSGFSVLEYLRLCLLLIFVRILLAYGDVRSTLRSIASPVQFQSKEKMLYDNSNICYLIENEKSRLDSVSRNSFNDKPTEMQPIRIYISPFYRILFIFRASHRM
ncbi:hypothetical protein Pint_36125 [Pistacia integerrima]|uniref:Uncharacterized protein n=1 Tax=Pistacia integerrima TaxID=434235 RepID=A0ACC0Y554_9ROSI|nr:hypothetical protein Pint_36125 [Pistacia integerrima]